jgi:hypothetical protein
MSDNLFGFIVQILWEVNNGECNMSSFQPQCGCFSFLMMICILVLINNNIMKVLRLVVNTEGDLPCFTADCGGYKMHTYVLAILQHI